MNIKNLIIRNTIANIIGRIWHMLVWFFLFPFIVKHVGIAVTGTWLFVLALATYFMMLHFVISIPLTKKVAELHALSKTQELVKTVQTAFTAACCGGVLAGIGLFFSANYAVYHCVLTDVVRSDVRNVIAIASVITAIILLAEMLGAVFKGLQRYDVYNAVEVSASVVRVIMTLIFLPRYGGVIVLALIFGVEIVFRCVTYLIIFMRIPMPLMLYPFRWHWPLLLPLMRNGIFLIITTISTTIIVQTNKMLIGLILSVSMIVYYEAAVRIYVALSRIPQVLLVALFPAASAFEARNDHEAIREMCVRGTKYTLAVFIPVSFCVFFFARELITLWLGADFAQYAHLVRILVIGVVCICVTNAATQLLKGMYHLYMRLLLSFYGAIIAVTLLLSFIFVHYWKLTGIVIAMVMPYLLFSGPYLKRVYRLFNINKVMVYKDIILRLLPECCVVLCVVIAARMFFVPSTLMRMICAAGCVGSAGYGMFIRYGLDVRERRYLMSIYDSVKTMCRRGRS